MSKVKVKNEADWLALRQSVITATEAPILLGLNKYQSPSKMLKEKREKTFMGNSYTRIGQVLEPVVVEFTNEILKTNFQLIEKDGQKVFYMHPIVALGATPDAIEGNMFLECKTTKPLNFLKYSNSPPPYYIMQLMVQLHCAGFKEGYLSIMSTDLTQHTQTLKVPMTIFKVTKREKLCILLEKEVKRALDCEREGKMFRVNGEVRNIAKLLTAISYERVY